MIVAEVVTDNDADRWWNVSLELSALADGHCMLASIWDTSMNSTMSSMQGRWQVFTPIFVRLSLPWFKIMFVTNTCRGRRFSYYIYLNIHWYKRWLL